MSTNEKNQEKGSITIADLIVAVAVVVFVLFTYFGLSFEYGLAISILVILGFVATIVLFLYGLTKVKMVKNNFKKWLILEIALLALFITGATFISRPMVTSLSATLQKGELTEQGKVDIAAIEDLFVEYEKRESEMIEEIKMSFRNIQNARVERSAKEIISQTKRDLHYNDYCDEILTSKYLGDGGEGKLNYSLFKNQEMGFINDAYQIVESWNILKISTVAALLSEKADTIAMRLTKISKQRHPDYPDVPYKYVLKRNAKAMWVLDQEKTGSLEIDYNQFKQELSFKKQLLGAKSIWAYVIVVVVFLFMLLGYFVAPRSTTVEIGKSKDEEDGGVSLYE